MESKQELRASLNKDFILNEACAGLPIDQVEGFFSLKMSLSAASRGLFGAFPA
jgi:hypothetical protein